MDITPMNSHRVFLDTSHAIALSAVTDRHHQAALDLSALLESENATLVTTRAVMLEIGNVLAKYRLRHIAVNLLAALEKDARLEIVPLSESLYERAFRLYRERSDKEWGLTDRISFVVMQERGITDALTMDEHFQQAGFRALLRAN